MWITITDNDVRTRLTAAEMAAYTSRALAPGQLDPLPDLAAQVAREVRGHVAGGGNRLGVGLTIPDELLAAAADMIVFRLTTRLGFAVKDDRRTANDQAKTLMGQVGRGEFKVVGPETADAAQAASGWVSLVGGRVRQTEDLSGL